LNNIFTKTFIILIISQFLLFSCKSEKVEVKDTEKTTEIKTETKSEKTEVKQENTNQIKLSESELKNSGLKIARAEKISLPDYLRASGEIEENENFTTHINSKLSGRASGIFKSVGDYVSKGELLATIESKDIAALQSELL